MFTMGVHIYRICPKYNFIHTFNIILFEFHHFPKDIYTSNPDVHLNKPGPSCKSFPNGTIQGLSQELETGCPELKISKYLVSLKAKVSAINSTPYRAAQPMNLTSL